MGEALNDFIKNAGVVTLLHLLMTSILVVVSLATLAFRKSRISMTICLVFGIIPAISGILTYCYEKWIADHRMGMFAPLSEKGVAAVRQQGFVDLMVGVGAAVLILGLSISRHRLNQRRIIR